jgi:hypothetical protein
MTLQVISDLGKGGAGTQGQDAGGIFAIAKELQGLTISLVTGGSANTKFDLAAIRQEDTVVKAINNATGGVLTDITSTISMVDCRAAGTLTLVSAVAAETVEVNGITYTGVAGVPANFLEFSIDTSDTAAAASLAAAINAREANYGNTVTATSAAGVVTVLATAEGTGPNAYTLVGDTNITASAATLLGGTATGGIKSTGATDQIVLFWFNKNT